MSAALREWLSCAPKPLPLKDSQRWHVFISYRSVNRYWVLELYDILRQLGYSVFLDQYVLSGAAPLALTLGEALDTSAAAILVWSDTFEDSAWCKQEFGKLMQRETTEPEFSYVIAKLDKTVLTGLPAQKIYVDFSDRKEGPGGSDILRVLYGLVKSPLPEKAVKLAAQVDEEISQARISIAAARLNGDFEQLIELAKTDSLAWANSPMLGCAVADALLSLGKNDDALQLANQLCDDFPKTARPRQLKGLAEARKGNWKAAQTILGGLYVSGEIDPETLGIYARTWMDRYNETKDTRYLLKSRELYRQAFETNPKDYYTGINAATKSLLLDETQTASQLAARVEGIVGQQAIPGDYWRTATIAEVQLLQAKYAQAATLYEAAVSDAPEEFGSHASTCKQARLILEHLQASAEDSAAVLKAFDHLARAVDAR